MQKLKKTLKKLPLILTITLTSLLFSCQLLQKPTQPPVDVGILSVEHQQIFFNLSEIQVNQADKYIVLSPDDFLELTKYINDLKAFNERLAP